VTARGHDCRSCGAPIDHVVLDLGAQPLANAYPDPADVDDPEPHYPLQVGICTACWLVQLTYDVDPTLVFDAGYAYFSSVSESWLAHADAYAARMVDALILDADGLVVEVASNDGYLLRSFVSRGVPVLGIEPSANVAAAAEADGVPTRVEFFGRACAEALRAEGVRPDLVVGNNVLAHVPDLDDFVGGLATLIGESGLLTMEFPHLLSLLEHGEFDTIYHEHYSYFSLLAACDVFRRRGMEIVDVELLTTHGGSLRIHARAEGAVARSSRVDDVLERERSAGLDDLDAYRTFADDVARVRTDLLTFLHQARDGGRKVLAYGAPAKGNTLLNYCRVTPELVPFTVDRSPVKQGRVLPGTHLPIEAPERLVDVRPDYVLVLPWNIVDEITAQMAVVRDWGGRFVVPIPRLRVLD
jgi:hypothetical protein